MPDATPAAAAKASTTSTVVSAFRRMMELMLMLAAALAALFFYKSAEETEKERERLEKARVVSALARFARDGSMPYVDCRLVCIETHQGWDRYRNNCSEYRYKAKNMLKNQIFCLRAKIKSHTIALEP